MHTVVRADIQGPPLGELLPSWVISLQARRISLRTIDSYLLAAHQLGAWLEANGEPRLDANPEYDWCRSFDVTSQVDEDLRGDNSVHVPRAAWDRFVSQQRYRRDLR